MPASTSIEDSGTVSQHERVDHGGGPLKITLISLHGLIRGHDMELGRDADTGGQVKYVIELARELAAHENVREVELLTRQVIDPKVDDDYAKVEEVIGENAKIIRIPFGPKRYLKKEALWPYIEMFNRPNVGAFPSNRRPQPDPRPLCRRGTRRSTFGSTAARSLHLHRTLAWPGQAATSAAWKIDC